MRLKCRRFALILFTVYVFASGYAGYKLFISLSANDGSALAPTRGMRPIQGSALAPARGLRPIYMTAVTDSRKAEKWDLPVKSAVPQTPPPGVELVDVKYNVEIWGKAAISLYLWKHILEADVVDRMSGVWSFGQKQIEDINFSFRTGPGVVPDKVPQDVENLILVLNGRDESKIAFSTIWLDYLPNYKTLTNCAVVLLGNEQCNNTWIKPYMAMNGGLVKFVFIVYDSVEVDDFNFYQWPLGVATYRDFPLVDISTVNSEKHRQLWCNFMGTIYANSSRQELLEVLQDPVLAQHCLIKFRAEWWPKETAESQASYIQALLQSDYTLSPVGMNAECYRIYEAMSYGSIPILEDVTTSPNCHTTPYQLLREYNAPVIYVNNWGELPGILDYNDDLFYATSVVKHRQNVLEWYAYFKQKMNEKFVRVIKQRFFK